MKKILLGFVLAFFTLGACAADKGTADEAVALVKKAVALVKAKGRDTALAEFNNSKGPFVDRDLYIFVIDKDGTTVANGVNARLVGKNVKQLKDADGKYFIQNLIEIGDTKGHGWLEYKWSNQTTQAMEMKQTYVEKVDHLYVACGIYK
ncbi:MAG: cache domain-containing protein [Pseudomonadota bacterium]